MSRTKRVAPESPSKRLRSTYYKLFEKDDEGFKEFEDYYNSKMEKLIKHFKKLLTK